MSKRIPVTVVAGGLGSGKTAVLNGWDATSGLCDVVVLSHSLVGMDCQRAYQVNEGIYIHEAGCLCCAVRGDLVQTLQRLFMDALHRKIPKFSHIVIEASANADPVTFKYLVAYERFLADRYVYAGCLTLVDVTQRLPDSQSPRVLATSGLGFARVTKAADANTDVINDADAADRVALAQIQTADVLVLTHTDQASSSQLARARSVLQLLNPRAVCHTVQTLPGLGSVFEEG